MSAPIIETALQKEQRLFRELYVRLRDALLNRMFDLSPVKAAKRSSYVFVLFFFSGFVISLIYYSPSEWTEKIGAVFNAILSSTSTAEQLNLAINDLFAFLLKIVLDPRILQYLPVFLASFFIALQTAAIYLADVFELDDVGVAREFISSVALSGGNETVHIKQGDIAEESMESPAFLIGGPGKVLVEIDSVALFEKADGTPHIIGPTGKESGGKATLEGFERFRQALDIRDHYIDLRDQDDRSRAVKSRSRDGIPIKATDVRLMFSIFRGDNPESSIEYPYPFSEKAVEQIVYRASSLVTPDQPYPSTFKFSWINNMVGLIRGRLSGFMSQHNLTEYMASIGLPEVEKVKQREEVITKQVQLLTQTDEGADTKEIKPPPAFQARYKIKNLFTQFADEFTGKARNNGVELHWIGVGTWESPAEVVLGNHLEAWLLTQENLKKDSPEAMNKLEQEEVIEKMKELIQKVPLGAYEEIVTETYQIKRAKRQSPKKKPNIKLNSSKNDDLIIPPKEMDQVLEILQKLQGTQEQRFEEAEEENIDHEMKALLIEYRKLFRETEDLIKAKKEPVHPNLQEAIKILSNQIGHWAGSY